MENYTYLSCDDVPWQASSPCIFLNFKDELLAAIRAPGIIPQRAPMKLTQEALYMIHVMLVFVGLAFLGSTITSYELFFKDNEKKSESRKSIYKENNTIRRLGEKKPFDSQDFLEDCKSFFKCFCMVRNGRKILRTSATEAQINCFQGLRCLSNASIIGFHFLLVYASILRHMEDLKPLLDLRVSQLGPNSMFAVDVFFVISGFLNADAFFHTYSRSCGNISWFHFFFKRFGRLTPVYMIVLGFYTTLFTNMGTGFLWPTYATNPICRKNWWWHLLYINNFENSDKQCLDWCWSLAADMQFYIISPLFMIPLIRWPRFGYALILACISGSGIISFVLTYQYDLIDGLSRFEIQMRDLKTSTHKFWEYFEVLHIKPYTRISSYLVAVLLAYYLRKKKSNKTTIKNSAMTLFCGWITTALFMWICFFSQYKREETLMEKALYNSTKDLTFSIGFAWIIYLCLTGQSEFLNRFLSWKFFLPLSRLSYCAFLIHPLVLVKLFLQSQDFMDFSCVSMIWLYLYVCGCTYVVSFFASIFFEIPILNLLEQFGKKKMKKNSSMTHLD